MKLTLRTPKKKTRRAKALDAAGNVVGAVRKRATLLRALVPTALAATVATLIARRRRSRAAVETWVTPEDQSERVTETKRNKAEATGGDDDEPPPQAPGTPRNAGSETTASGEVAEGGGRTG